MRPLILLALLVLAAPLCAQWSFTREKYSCTMNDMTWQELANAGITYVSHVDAKPEVAAEAHRWGIKIMPYVSLYKVIDTSIDPGYRTEPFWKEIDLVQHPTWALIRPDGKVRLPFDDPNYPKGIFQSCCNQPGILEAYVRGVQNVLATGADGIFVDNVHPYPTCYGPELGLHQHLDPTKNNTEMYKAALAACYKAVQDHGPGYATMLNSGGPSHDYIGYGDTLMWESWVFRWPEANWENRAVTCRTHDWKAVLEAYDAWKDFTDKGGSIAPYTYLPIPELEKPHSYLAFVCAKLCGFQQWTASGSSRQDIVRQLVRADLGMPVGPLEHDGTVYFRRYEGGLVAGNSASAPARATLPWALKSAQAADMYDAKLLPVVKGRLAVELPPDCGRVYVTPSAYLANVLGETAGMAQSLALRLEKAAATDDDARAKQQLALKAYRQANQAWQAAKRAMPSSAAEKQPIMQLPDMLAGLEEKPQAPVQARLMAGGNLPADALPGLFRAKTKKPFGIKLAPDRVQFTSGGADFVFDSQGQNLTARLGDTGVSFWVSPTTKDNLGWLHARRLRDAKVTVDKPDLKTVQFVVTLYARNSDQEVSDFDLLVEATVRRDVPAIEIASSLRNHTAAPVPAYWFWNLSASLHTFPDGTTVQPSDWGAPPKGVAWDYLHTQQNRGGVVLTGWTNLGYGGGQADVFAEPKDQTIPADGQMPIRFTAYAAGSGGSDAFIARRLRWYEQYASLAAEMAAGGRAELQAPPQFVAGVPADVTVAATGGKGLAHGLSATIAGAPLAVSEQTPGRFSVLVPDRLSAGDQVELTATVRVQTPLGGVTLREFETVGLRPAVELLNIRQAPGGAGAVALAVTLHSNLPRALPVTVQLTAGGTKLAPASATLPPDADTETIISVPGAVAPANTDRLDIQAHVAYELTPGKPLSLDVKREIALLPQAVCQTAANPPVIDGKLTDSPWTFATRLTNFVHYDTGVPAKEQTTCLVMNDDANLNLGLTCLQADTKHLRAGKPDASGLYAGVCNDDSVEIYVDPRQAGAPYFRLVLNSLGAAKSTATGGWTVATSVEADRWIAEVTIPFRLIGATPKTGDVWGINVCRNNQSNGEETCWSRSPGGYANPERFGGLKFETGGH